MAVFPFCCCFAERRSREEGGQLSFIPGSPELESSVQKLRRALTGLSNNDYNITKEYDGRWPSNYKRKFIHKDAKATENLISGVFTPSRLIVSPWDDYNSKKPLRNCASSIVTPSKRNYDIEDPSWSSENVKQVKSNIPIKEKVALEFFRDLGPSSAYPARSNPSDKIRIFNPSTPLQNHHSNSSPVLNRPNMASQSSPIIKGADSSEFSNRKGKLSELAMKRNPANYSISDKENNSSFNSFSSPSSGPQRNFYRKETSLYDSNHKGHKDGFKNLGQTCYIASILQFLFYSPLKGK
jgi:hypothetical protein